MGASNNTGSAGTLFFKLLEKKENDKPTGVCRFVQQEKVDNQWTGTNEFSSLTGYFIGAEIKEYEYQGKKKEQLSVTLQDNESPSKIVFSIGFTTTLAQNILNTLAGEQKYGLFSFECGNPNEWQGKLYTTLWMKNDGQKTEWAYGKAKGNADMIPKVTKTTDAEGNDIYTGRVAANDFWKKILAEVNERAKKSEVPANNFVAAAQGKPEDRKARDAEFMQDMNDVTDEDLESLPF